MQADTAGRLPVDCLPFLIEWRQLLDVDGGRTLSGSESQRWRQALRPLVRPDPSAARTPGNALPSLDGHRRSLPGQPGVGERLLAILGHPDSRISESLVLLTTPAPGSGPAAMPPLTVLPLLLAGDRGDGAAWVPPPGSALIAARWDASRDLLQAAWTRVERDVAAELRAGTVLSPLQRALLEQWLTLVTLVQRAESRGESLEGWRGFGPSGALTAPPALVDQILAATTAALAQAPLSQPPRAEDPFTPPQASLYDEILSGLNGVVDQTSLSIRDAVKAVPLTPLVDRLLQHADALPGGRAAWLRHVLRHEVTHLVDWDRIHPLGVNVVHDALLAQMERLPVSARTAWEHESAAEAQAQLARAGRTMRDAASGAPSSAELGAPLGPPPGVPSVIASLWPDATGPWWPEGDNDQPMLWRIHARLTGKDPARDPLQSPLETGNWVWRRFGQGPELEVNLLALAQALQDPQWVGAGDQDLALSNLMALTPGQIASLSVRAIRPFLSAPSQPIRTWAIQALSLVRRLGEDGADAAAPVPPASDRSR